MIDSRFFPMILNDNILFWCRGKPLKSSHGMFKELAEAYCNLKGLKEKQLSFGSSDLRKKAATAVDIARGEREISTQDQEAFAASELHNIDVEQKYYIEASFAPGKVRSIPLVRSFQGMNTEEILKERTKLIKRGMLMV